MSEPTRDDLLTELHRMADSCDKVPSASEFDDAAEYTVYQCKKEFGSWNETVKAAGFRVNYRSGLTDDELIEELQRLAEELGRSPTAPHMTDHGEFGESIYKTRFGSWNEALRAAGLTINSRHGISDDELLSELQDLTTTLGRPPRMKDMREHGEFDPYPYYCRFGSWNEGLRKAGLSINRMHGVESDELIDGLRKLADELGHTPSVSEMRKQGGYDWKSYRRVFGSWDAGIMEAGFEPWDAPTGEDSPAWVDGYESYYGPNWIEQREQAIQRDGEVCALASCDVSRDQHRNDTGRDLSVHHIERKGDFRRDDGSLDYETANQLSNLITLCAKHHKQYEGFPLDVRHLGAAD